jgi:eukaryotic-like serine/threonine-protein kinase
MAGSTGSAYPSGSVDPVRWARARDLFHAALDLKPNDRDAFLESACGSDNRLREEVSSLLVSDEQAGTFIEQPAATLLTDSGTCPFTPRFTPGVVVGRFEILEFLGAGGISEVYRARDSRLGRTVALKFVTDPADREAGSRLLVEAQHASILNHPNICAVHEVENDDDLPFIVLELVEGPTVSDVLKERRPAIREVIQWAKEIAAALDHAHRRGVIHRDLKSANVAVSPDGSIKVLDFGLSRQLTGTNGLVQSPAGMLTNASVAGTLTHIAPEVLKGAILDHRVDLWAFGVMLYQMTTGVLPFKRATECATASAILDEAPDPLPVTVPIDLRRVIERCLTKDPASRFATAKELRGALEAGRLESAASWRSGGKRAAFGALVVATAIAGWVGWQRFGTLDTATPMLAVLPIENAGGDAAQTFFADGVTEALIAELGRIDGIRVIAAGTSMRSRDTATSASIARTAGANRVLKGSVGKAGKDVRLSAHLLDASSGQVIWSQDFHRDTRQVQALYSTVAEAVARAVRVEVRADDAKHLAAVRAVDPDVYEAYLKGRYHWNQRTADSLRTAVAYFESALKLDPTYAPAYAALADCYNLLGTVMVSGGSPTIWRPKAAEAAIKALQIDSDLAEAHATLGYVRHYNWEWQDAERSFVRAIALNPSNSLAHIWYANFLCSRLRFDEAIREVTVARELDPLSLIVNTNVGWVLYMARRNDDAIQQLKKTLLLDPSYQQAQSRLAGAYILAKRFDDAIELSVTAARASTGQPINGLVAVEQVKMLAGRPNQFEQLLDDMVAHLSERYVSSGAIANYYFSLRRRDDEGFRWLEKAYRERTNNIAYLAVEPMYDRVRDDPRFTALLRAVGLP